MLLLHPTMILSPTLLPDMEMITTIGRFVIRLFHQVPGMDRPVCGVGTQPLPVPGYQFLLAVPSTTQAPP